jgi:hypothetical protein
MLRKVSGGWQVFSEKGDKKLSKVLPTREAAKRRLKQVEYFKNK